MQLLADLRKLPGSGTIRRCKLDTAGVCTWPLRGYGAQAGQLRAPCLLLRNAATVQGATRPYSHTRMRLLGGPARARPSQGAAPHTHLLVLDQP